MKSFYITFGQIHTHSVAGVTFDKDSICEVRAEDETVARQLAFETFGQKWGFLYSELPDMSLYPRGVYSLDGTKSKTHFLKTFTPYFEAWALGNKPWEIRVEDEKRFEVGDTVIRMNQNPETGEILEQGPSEVIIYVLRDFVGLAPGYVAFSTRPIC